MKSRPAICVATLVSMLVGGCASNGIPAVTRYGAYCEMLNPLVANASKEQVLRRFGMPSKKEQVGDAEVWQYLKNYGQQAVAASNADGSKAVAISLGIYDDVTIIFDANGKLQSWQADVR